MGEGHPGASGSELASSLDAAIAKAVEGSGKGVAIDHPPFSRLLGAAAAAGRFEEMSSALEHAERTVVQAGGSAAVRSLLATALREALEQTEVIVPLLHALDDRASADWAAVALRHVRPAFAPSLLDRLSALKTTDGQRRLASAIALTHPKPDALIERLGTKDKVLGRELIRMLDETGEDIARKVRLAALEHEDPAVRRAVVGSLKKPQAAALRDALLPMLGDDDAGVRGSVLRFLVVARDPEAAGAIAALLEGRLDVPERRSMLVALGTLGGAKAAEAIRRELSARKDPEITAACVLALAQVEGPDAKPDIEAASKGFLVSKRVKEACAEALRRIAAMPARERPAEEAPNEEPPKHGDVHQVFLEELTPDPGLEISAPRAEGPLELAGEETIAPAAPAPAVQASSSYVVVNRPGKARGDRPAASAPDRRAHPRNARLVLEAKMQIASQTVDVKLVATDLSLEGVFLETADPPVVGTLLKLLLAVLPGKMLPVDASVMRAIRPDEAKAKGMAPGAGVKFDNLTAATRTLLEQAFETSTLAGGEGAESQPAFLVRRLAPEAADPLDRRSRAAALLASGREAFEQGLFARAMSDLHEARLFDPDDAEIRSWSERAAARAGEIKASSSWHQGLYCESRQDTDGAWRAFREAAALAPRNPEYCRKAGKYALDAGEMELARRFLIAAAGADPEDAETHFLLATCYARAGMKPYALRAAKTAAALAPDRADVKALLKELS